MANINYSHPHVVINTIDQSTTVSDVNSGGSSLYTVFESERGLDGTIQKFNSKSQFIQEYGTPNFKKYGQACLNAVNWLAAGGEVYSLRVLPDNAKHAHSILAFYADSTGNTIMPVTYYNAEVNYTEDELTTYIDTIYDSSTNITPDSLYNIYDILAIYSQRRGVYYNDIGFKLERNTSYSNTYTFPMYNFYTIKENSNGTYDTIEGPFIVALYPDAQTSAGVSLFIKDVVNRYSDYLTIEVNEDNLDQFIEDYGLDYTDDLLFGASLSNSEVTFITDETDQEARKLSAYNDDNEETFTSYKTNFNNLVTFINAGDETDIDTVSINNVINDSVDTTDFETALFLNTLNISTLGAGIFETLTANTGADNYLIPYKLISSNYIRTSYSEIIDQLDELIAYYRDVELSHSVVYKHKLYVYENWTDYGLESQPESPTDGSTAVQSTINVFKQIRRNIISKYLSWSAKLTTITELIANLSELSTSGKLQTEIKTLADSYYTSLSEIRTDIYDAITYFNGKAYSLTSTADQDDISLTALTAAKTALNAYSSSSVFTSALGDFVTAFNSLAYNMKDAIDNSETISSTGFAGTISDAVSKLMPGVLYEYILEYLNTNVSAWGKTVGTFEAPTTTDYTLTAAIKYNIDFDKTISGNLYDSILDDVVTAQNDLSETYLFTSDEVEISRGSDGTISTTAERDYLIKNGFAGEIQKKKEYPIDVILDANYSDIVKYQIVDLVTDYRDDVFAYLDEGIKYPSTASLSMLDRDNRFVFNNNNIALFSQHLVVTDPYTSKDIKVTPTYFISTLLPKNDLENGLQYPLAGLSRGVISIGSYKQLSFNPTMQEKSNLYDDQINYIEQDPRRAKLSTQLTAQTRRSALSYINNTRVVKRIRREVAEIAEKYIQEFNDSTTLSAMSFAINDNLKQWKENRACTKATAKVYASEYDQQNGIVRVRIEVEFTGVIETVAIDLVIQ